MKRNIRISVICGVVLLLAFVWIMLLDVWSETESIYTCKVEENLFSMGMESMNETRKETFPFRLLDNKEIV